MFILIVQKEARTPLVRAQDRTHLFSMQDRHWHRFSAGALCLSQSLLRNNHIPQQRMQRQMPGLALKSSGPWAHHLLCIEYILGYGNHPPALKLSTGNKSILTSKEGSEDTLDKRIQLYPLLSFPTARAKTTTTTNSLEKCWGLVRNWLAHTYQAPTEGQNISCNPCLCKADRGNLIAKAAAQTWSSVSLTRRLNSLHMGHYQQMSIRFP